MAPLLPSTLTSPHYPTSMKLERENLSLFLSSSFISAEPPGRSSFSGESNVISPVVDVGIPNVVEVSALVEFQKSPPL
ncbi:unnamed protein product [Lactuca saligna]|uniref:Uncharacterized protein n=1 Tax=Lactuca saligna TaxID=75948 RepID=A0AA36EMF5_LACSI|nr:unnamed protein product [Lactuca saligna]